MDKLLPLVKFMECNPWLLTEMDKFVSKRNDPQNFASPQQMCDDFETYDEYMASENKKRRRKEKKERKRSRELMMKRPKPPAHGKEIMERIDIITEFRTNSTE